MAMETVSVPVRADSPHDDVPAFSNVKPGDIIIAVMGITGCGKTTFVNLFSEYPLVVGHTLDSCTSAVQVAPCTLEDGTKFWLVDTPGFDDTYRSDSEILREVSLWLNKAHESELKLTGIIFLQRISDVRVGGSGIRNIKMFQKLCGDETLASVVLATTMWDMTSEKAAIDREKELKQQPLLWKRMIDHGSQVYRHDKDKISATSIIKYLVERKAPVTLDIQVEMVDQNLQLQQTGAGNELSSSLEKLIEYYEKKLQELDQEMKARIKTSQEERDLLEASRKEHQENLARTRADIVNLQTNAEQMMLAATKQYEECAEKMKQSEENHAQELEKQRILLQKQFKDKYLQMMSDRACVVM